MDRRSFVVRFSAGLLAAPALVSISAACDGSYGDGYGAPGGVSQPPPASTPGIPVTNTDTSGHSHSFTIACADGQSPGRVYTATGSHTHQVPLSAEQLDAIMAGQTVTVQTTDGHPHTWIIHRPNGVCA